MTRFTQLIALALASALIAATGFVPASTATTTTPIDHLVDCSDSFWAIACFGEAPARPETEPETETAPARIIRGDAEVVPEAPPLGLIRIDNDPVCEEIDGGFIICHT